ncbi:hypothetical protein GGX14DRAFT_562831 [Mycena pura]|uniref:RING-type domain-containing protein n=1 Tax=Mycena pura TaxID=153505 RepID=A0AAD6YJ96_9AGAR|nr:hypothetical protein GGX14DRAFT_562831 [Mycena pura]
MLCTTYRPLMVDVDVDDAEHEYMRYALDLGADTDDATPWTLPTPPQSPRPTRRLPVRLGRARREPSGDCGICFEHAVEPVRTPCCANVFCVDHIAAWLHGPASDGHCPACRAPSASSTPSPSPPRARSPGLCSHTSADCSSLTSSRSASPDRHFASSSSSESSRESSCEDATDYSFAALERARSLQRRRHTSHPLDAVLGVHGGARALLRAAVCVLVIAVLAGRGRWGARAA